VGGPVQRSARDEFRGEWLKCRQSSAYFIHTYCQIYDATASIWIPFQLWPGQRTTLKAVTDNRLVVILKARQLGMTWLILCYILWRMVFHPSFTALLFSRRETEATYLLGKERLRGIYQRLPAQLKVRSLLTDSSHVWQLSNGSVAYGFPTTAGDSYTASMAFVDEADLVPDLDKLMNAVKPTIDGGGRMVLLSRTDKTKPNSTFKRTYRGAVKGENDWKPVFLPWWTRPERDQEWYDEQKRDIYSRTTAYDDLFQQYPATSEEALRPPTLDRRIPFQWLTDCYEEWTPLETDIDISHLKVYLEPQEDSDYAIGVDPAEGNPESDPSVAIVIDVDTQEEVAVLSGKIEPAVLAGYCVQLAAYYNDAEIMVERNNHGHAVILALVEIYATDPMYGLDKKYGWMSSRRGKALLYATAAEEFRTGRALVHDPDTYAQLVSIEGDTLKAPEGDYDDQSMGYVLALSAASMYALTIEVGTDPTASHRG